MRKVLHLLIALCYSSCCVAQLPDAGVAHRWSKTYQIWYAACAVRVNTNYVSFANASNTYTFAKAHYTPNIAGGFTWGWLDSKHDFLLNVGLSLITATADLTMQTGQALRYTEGIVQVPVELGTRFPIRYVTNKNGFTHSMEIRAGLFVEKPVTGQLDDKRNIDATPTYITGDFIKAGVIAEIHYLSLDRKGHGHNLGFKIYTDEPKWILINKETNYRLYPYFYNIGLFYTIYNK